MPALPAPPPGMEAADLAVREPVVDFLCRTPAAPPGRGEDPGLEGPPLPVLVADGETVISLAKKVSNLNRIIGKLECRIQQKSIQVKHQKLKSSYFVDNRRQVFTSIKP